MAKLPVARFLEARLKEYDSRFEVRKGTGFEQLFFKPIQFITQPIIDEAVRLEISQSLLRIRQQENPDDYSEEAVDALVANVYVYRVEGSKSGGTARVYYAEPVEREWPSQGAVFTGSNGMTYRNPAPFSITSTEMGAQYEDGTYYYDIPVIADDFGDAGNLEADGLVDLTNDPDVIRVTNIQEFVGGRERETNTQLISRAEQSIGVRALETGKGFKATFFANYSSFLTELQPIGMGDIEMMRDVLFNTHVGGRVDGFFKTTSIRTGSKDFIGVLTDTTRQAFASRTVGLIGTNWIGIGDANIDRSNNKTPVVMEAKARSIAKVTSTQTFPIDLSGVGVARPKIRATIDGITRDVAIVGSSMAAITRNEVMAAFNTAFPTKVAYSQLLTVELRSTDMPGSIILDTPDDSYDIVDDVFGIPASKDVHYGDSALVFEEDLHYEIDDVNGQIRRIQGPDVLGSEGDLEDTGSHSTTAVFTDATIGAFSDVEINDILTIVDGDEETHLRIIDVIDENNIEVEMAFDEAATDVEYYIHRSGIKDGEGVAIEYWFNPLSIDIGPLVVLDEYGRERGVRPGREDYTITDVALLRIRSIELIDPISREPLGEVLVSGGGYGSGEYGAGPYGVGSSDYTLVVNRPTERFSAFEDSYINLNPGLIGLSFRVTYDYVPEIMDLHNFARSDVERLLGGDILMKHFLPAYVSGTIEYSVDATDASIPDNDTLTELLKQFINQKPAGESLEYSDIYQFISRKTDPFDKYRTYIKPFTLSAVIHNTDGSTTYTTGDGGLSIPTLEPFPSYTVRPLSARITHWIADEITLVRV